MTKQEAWQLIDSAGGPAAVAVELHIPVIRVLGWIERGDVPHRYLLAIRRMSDDSRTSATQADN